MLRPNNNICIDLHQLESKTNRTGPMTASLQQCLVQAVNVS